MGVTAVEAWPAKVAGDSGVARWAAAGWAAVGLAACALSLAAPPLRGLPMHPAAQLIHAAVTAAYVGAGVVALARRPGNATGPLMIAVGLLWLVPDLGWIPRALPFTVAATFAQLYQPILAHLALAFPSGRLPGRTERRVVTGLYGWTVLNNVVIALFSDPARGGCTHCPRNLLLVDSNIAVQDTLNNVTTAVSVLLVVSTAALIVRHWRRATRAARHIMAPALWVVAPAAGYIAAAQIGDLVTFGPTGHRVVNDYLPIGLAVLPVGFLIGLLRTRLAYAHVGALAAELDGPVAPGRVRDVLARMLHDPSLELFYWVPSSHEYVDIDGNPCDPDSHPTGRTSMRIRGESGPLAVMVVDAAALGEPGLLRAAESMTRLALENERLQAEVRSQLVQLRLSTARLVDAGQEARRRIERDLHDGAQQRLLALSMTLGQARAQLGSDTDKQIRAYLDSASTDLQEAIDELRELARGIHPVLLTSEGIASALQALAERAPLPVSVTAPSRRFPDTTEATAYFVVSEAVTNAARHSNAQCVVITLSDHHDELVVDVVDDGVGGVDHTSAAAGSGLQGMHDRATAAGGHMTVSSPPGAGTRITVRLPCG